MNLRILHISNAFSKSSIYKNLMVSLDSLGVEQIAYSAVRTRKEANYNPPELDHLDIYINYLLRPYDRLLFRNKVRKVSRDVLNEIALSSVDLIHAHTLYSDGAVALKIKRKIGKPYVVAVRNTDLNAFQKYRPDLRWRRNEILSEAEKIILISPAHKKHLLSLLSESLKKRIRSKTDVIPNGLDPLFLDSPEITKKEDNSVKLLYVGSFRFLKNVPKLIKAVDILYDNMNIMLTIVGEGGGADKEVKKMINSIDYPFINYRGKVKDREKLKRIYGAHDIFVMPSQPETFGLVYIEALSQGLPIIYTKGEGVDGYFDDKFVGKKVHDVHDEEEIARKIKYLSTHLNQKLRKQCILQAQEFDWRMIAQRYRDIYDKII